MILENIKMKEIIIQIYLKERFVKNKNRLKHLIMEYIIIHTVLHKQTQSEK